jgi:acyl-CoA thioesterase-1
MLRINLISTLFLSSFLLSSCTGNPENEAEEGNLKSKPSEAAPTASNIKVKEKNILFFGTSLTAGYGLEQKEAYPALIQAKLKEMDLPYRVINAGLSGETSAAGNSRIDWLLKQPVSIFILELGANDGLRGVSVAETTANLQAIIDKVKNKYPDAKLILAGMQMPPNMGVKYANDFRSMFVKLAEKNDMVFIPFLLEGVGGVPRLNQGDGIHPTAEGQKIMAENVWKILKDEL